MILKKRQFIDFIIQNCLSVLFFLFLSLIDLEVNQLFFVTLFSLLFHIYFVSKIFIRYPIELFNPFLILSIIYTIPFSISIIFAVYNNIVVWEKLLAYYAHIAVKEIINTLLIAYTFSLIISIIAYWFT